MKPIAAQLLAKKSSGVGMKRKGRLGQVTRTMSIFY